MTVIVYLTVPDVLWINLQVTGASQPYRFDRLEEATFYQYGHGSSRDLIGQAARLLTGFPRMRPFDRGNDATAFVAFLVFLEANGRPLTLEDGEALDWVRRVWADGDSARSAIESVCAQEGEAHHGAEPDKQEIALGAIARYRTTLGRLLAEEAPVPLGR